MVRDLHPLVASNWGRMTFIGGAYSHALPGHAAARKDLALPFEQRLFFAGEATHLCDFSTAHGAYDGGVRAAEVGCDARDGPEQLPLSAKNKPAISDAGDWRRVDPHLNCDLQR